MLAIKTFINVIWLPFIIGIAVFAGYAYRSLLLKQRNKRILSLENEMLKNHAEILKLQHELVTLEEKLDPHKSRVVIMKESLPEEKSDNPESPSQKRAKN